MPNNTHHYWDLHKQVYLQLFDELDWEIREKIINDPSSSESILFNKKVQKRLNEILERELAVESPS